MQEAVCLRAVDDDLVLEQRREQLLDLGPQVDAELGGDGVGGGAPVAAREHVAEEPGVALDAYLLRADDEDERVPVEPGNDLGERSERS